MPSEKGEGVYHAYDVLMRKSSFYKEKAKKTPNPADSPKYEEIAEVLEEIAKDLRSTANALGYKRGGGIMLS